MHDFWLPEPSSEDTSYPGRGEHALDWLARSTVHRAKECRRFLNENLSKLPPNAQLVLQHALRERWHSAFFELIVARCLQELGAMVTIERITTEGTRPDFLAQFPDGPVVVEAVAPVFNAETSEEAKWRVPLLNVIENYAPYGWYVGVWELPRIGPRNSQRLFKSKVASMLAIGPPHEGEIERELMEELPEGIIHLYLWPAPPGKHPLRTEPPLSVIDNSETRIRYAVKQKKRQVRSSDAPVLLAIFASGISSDLEDFDHALFGRTFERVDWHGRSLETGFQADGAFTVRRTEPPIFAGVIAFLEADFPGVGEPVLYQHPRFVGSLPKALLTLEQRLFDKSANQIRQQPSISVNLFEGLRFVRRGR